MIELDEETQAANIKALYATEKETYCFGVLRKLKEGKCEGLAPCLARNCIIHKGNQ